MRDGHKNKNRVRIILFVVSTRSMISRFSEADAVKHDVCVGIEIRLGCEQVQEALKQV